MPFSYDIDEGLGYCVAKASGSVTSDEFTALLDRLEADGRYGAGMRHLFDLRKVEGMQLDIGTVGGVVQACQNDDAMIALVASAGGVRHWGEGLEQLASGGSLRLRTFPRIEAAENWLVGSG